MSKENQVYLWHPVWGGKRPYDPDHAKRLLELEESNPSGVVEYDSANPEHNKEEIDSENQKTANNAAGKSTNTGANKKAQKQGSTPESNQAGK